MKAFTIKVFIWSLSDEKVVYASQGYDVNNLSGCMTLAFHEFRNYLKALPYRERDTKGYYCGVSSYLGSVVTDTKLYYTAVNKLLRPFNRSGRNTSGICYYIDIWDQEYLRKNKETFEEEVQTVQESPEQKSLC